MKPDLSRRNVGRLAREFGLPEGAVRQMLTMEAGLNSGDVVESTGSSRRKWRTFFVVAGLLALPLIYLAVPYFH